MKKIFLLILIAGLLLPVFLLASTVFDSFSADDSTQGISGVNWSAQTFTPSLYYKSEKVEVFMRKYNQTTSTDIILSIRATADGKPTSTDLCSGIYNSDQLQEGMTTWVEVACVTSLSADTQYAIVQRSPEATGDIRWRGIWTDSYGGGTLVTSGDSGDTWTVQNTKDFSFKVWGGQTYVPLSLANMSSIVTYITDLFDAVGGFIWVFIGVPLGFVVIRRLIKLLPKG